MKRGKEAMLTNHMEGYQLDMISHNDYEISFRRLLISQIDADNISIQEVRDRFHLNPTEYKLVITKKFGPKQYIYGHTCIRSQRRRIYVACLTHQAWYDSNKRQSGHQVKEVFILTEAFELRKS